MSNKTESVSIRNIYTLEGKVPVMKAIPFGLQHILAMFVANIAPICRLISFFATWLVFIAFAIWR